MKSCLFTGAIFLSAMLAMAAPDLRRGLRAAGFELYPDDQRPDRYYYAPGDLALVVDETGKPDLHFLQMRYTGTRTTGDQLSSASRSLLTFGVVMAPFSTADQNAAISALRKQTGQNRVQLRPLPIRRVETALLVSSASEPSAKPPKALTGGSLQERGQDPTAPSSGYWTRRDYTLNLDDDSSQLLWSLFEKGQLALSLGYAFIADGISGDDMPLEELTGTPSVVEALRGLLKRDATGTPQPSGTLVKAGALAITVDAARWPDLFMKRDINESLPAHYPLLDVYCYDFRDNLAPGVYEKNVILEAEGAGGGSVRVTIPFSSLSPETVARTVTFDRAVRLDQPYRYQVDVVFEDGREDRSDWLRRESWFQILDVTGMLVGSTSSDSDKNITE